MKWRLLHTVEYLKDLGVLGYVSVGILIPDFPKAVRSFQIELRNYTRK